MIADKIGNFRID